MYDAEGFPVERKAVPVRNEMIERCRDAMLRVNATSEGLSFSKLSEQMVRAVIAELREPTAQMSRAVSQMMSQREAYQAMLDAALAGAPTRV